MKGGWVARRTLLASVALMLVAASVTSGAAAAPAGGPIVLQLPPPTNLSPNGTTFPSTTTSVSLSWDPVSGAIGYDLRVRDETDGTLRDPSSNCPGNTIYLCIDRYASTSIALPVVPGHSYAWWIHAVDAGGQSGAANGTWFAVQGTQTPGARWVGPVVFHWFGPRSNPGQWQAVWHPLEGRDAWNGSLAFWTKQERDLIDAGFNFILFQVAYGWDVEMQNHLLASRDLLTAGQRAPRIAPMFAAESWPCYDCPKDFQTATGKDAAYQVFKAWFDDYFQILPLDRLVGLFGKVLVAIWYVPGCASAAPDILTYWGSRLQQDFGFTPYWSTHPCWAPYGPDEVNYLFAGRDPLQYGSMRNVDLLVGNWPPDPARYPAWLFLARDEGRTLAGAWAQVLASTNIVDRVYIESWNEYTEGTGMFEAQPASHWPGDGHPIVADLDTCWNTPCHPMEFTDSWGPSPRQYIRINALNANRFIGRMNDAAFVSQNVPPQMTTGQTYTVSVTMRNTGDTTWSRTVDHRLGSQNPQDNTVWGMGRVELDPYELVAPGQSRTFSFSVQAPSAPGDYSFQWRMVQEQVEWFGAATPNVIVSVRSPPPDTQPPTVAIVSPAQDSTVAGSVQVRATANDDIGVTRVVFRVDGVQIAEDATAPYSAVWDTTTVTDGSHAVTATAFDASGKSGEDSLTVTVRNAAPPRIARVEIDPASVSGVVGQTVRLRARALASGGNPVPGVSFEWWVEGAATSLSSATGPEVTLSLLAPGVGEVNVIARLGDESLSTSTPVTVRTAPPVSGPLPPFVLPVAVAAVVAAAAVAVLMRRRKASAKKP